MPNMTKWIDAAVAKWAARFARRDMRTVAERALPEDLREKMLEGIQRERERLQARMKWIDGQIVQAEAMKADARAQARALVKPIQRRPSRVIRLDGSSYLKPGKSRGAGVRTSASIEAGQRAQKIAKGLQWLRSERAGRHGELVELARLQRQTENGALTALARIARRWGTQLDIGVLMPKVKLGGSFGGYSDMFGNPLPDEALSATGEPDVAGLSGSRVTNVAPVT